MPRRLRREQRAVPLGDALTLDERSFARKRHVLAGVESRDVGADRPDPEPGVVDPRAVVVEEDAGPAGEVEPRVLGLLEVGEPLFAGVAAAEVRDELLLVRGACDCRGHAELDCQSCEPPKLLVGAQDEHVDTGHHLRDGLVRDVRESLSALLIEGEVRP